MIQGVHFPPKKFNFKISEFMNFKVIIFGANELLAYLADVAVVEVHLLDDARLPVRNQGCQHHTQTSVSILNTYTYTVCPGSSDPPEKRI